MTRFAVSALVVLAVAGGLWGCNHSDSKAQDGQDMVMAEPRDYTAAEKTAIQATFPAPFNTADLAAGEKQFNKCRACHTITPDGMNMTGPHLYGVFGRHSATAKDYTYSDAMMKHNVTWDFNTLDVYLKAPQEVVRGTKMGFMGIPNDADRRNLIAYLALETQAHEAASESASAPSK
ncbi:c-type cytochrome [Asticcacaulis solisilvae]|uniref:c-type cytochrome n=1 Tax=Asticcacaulis solisilvae TaxID=1217274 RepID=UPI003FD8A312